jgi:hypothetical protein
MKQLIREAIKEHMFEHMKKTMLGKTFEYRGYIGTITQVELIHNPIRILVEYAYCKLNLQVVTNYNVTTHFAQWIWHFGKMYGLDSKMEPKPLGFHDIDAYRKYTLPSPTDT